MVDRFPYVAGSFYPDSAVALDRALVKAFGQPAPASHPALLTLLPHAGYVYCADVMGATLSQVQLSELLFVLCPNHTGRGAPLAVWPDGFWHVPTGSIAVDATMARQLCQTDAGFSLDTRAHEGEHSIEVLLPFLRVHQPALRIVPVCVGVHDLATLKNAGQALGKLMLDLLPQNSALIVSSDMNHFANQQRTVELDELAIEALLTGTPETLYATVAAHQISMCGVFAAVLALYARAVFLHGTHGADAMPAGTLVRHSTSAEVSGDTRRVVGYAGVYF